MRNVTKIKHRDGTREKRNIKRTSSLPQDPNGEVQLEALIDRPDQEAELREERELLGKAIIELPPIDAQIINMRLDGQEWPAIVKATGLTPAGAKQRYHRALNALKKKFQ